MIGAMPAVALRHERRRAEKRRRPSQLPLQFARGYDDNVPSPDYQEIYLCGKIGVLHAVVGSMLFGIVMLVVGLVQMKPGAEAAKHRYYLIGSGAALVGIGIIVAIIRCMCLHCYNNYYIEEYVVTRERPAPQKQTVSVLESGSGHEDTQKDIESRPPICTQMSVIEEAKMIKQPSVTSDT